MQMSENWILMFELKLAAALFIELTWMAHSGATTVASELKVSAWLALSSSTQMQVSPMSFGCVTEAESVTGILLMPRMAAKVVPTLAVAVPL